MTETLLTWLKIIAAVAGTFTAVCAAFKAGRSWLGKAAKIVFAPLYAPWAVLRLMLKSDETKQAINELREEIAFEGEGTLPQNVMRLINRSAHMHQIQNRPALDMDQHGNILATSFILNQLFGVDTDNALVRHNWLQFLEESERLQFLDDFQKIAEKGASFRGTIALYDRQDRPLGVWTLYLTPIEPKIAGKMLFTGFFKPFNTVAKALAAERNLSV